jgi:hypothetical protein
LVIYAISLNIGIVESLDNDQINKRTSKGILSFPYSSKVKMQDFSFIFSWAKDLNGELITPGMEPEIGFTRLLLAHSDKKEIIEHVNHVGLDQPDACFLFADRLTVDFKDQYSYYLKHKILLLQLIVSSSLEILGVLLTVSNYFQLPLVIHLICAFFYIIIRNGFVIDVIYLNWRIKRILLNGQFCLLNFLCLQKNLALGGDLQISTDDINNHISLKKGGNLKLTVDESPLSFDVRGVNLWLDLTDACSFNSISYYSKSYKLSPVISCSEMELVFAQVVRDTMEPNYKDITCEGITASMKNRIQSYYRWIFQEHCLPYRNVHSNQRYFKKFNEEFKPRIMGILAEIEKDDKCLIPNIVFREVKKEIRTKRMARVTEEVMVIINPKHPLSWYKEALSHEDPLVWVAEQFTKASTRKREVKSFHQDVQFLREHGADFDRDIMPGIKKEEKVFKEIEDVRVVFDKLVIESSEMVEHGTRINEYKLITLNEPENLSRQAEERRLQNLAKATKRKLTPNRSTVTFTENGVSLQKQLNILQNVTKRRTATNKKLRNLRKRGNLENQGKLKENKQKFLLEEDNMRREILANLVIHEPAVQNNNLTAEDFILSQKIKYKIFISRISCRISRVKRKLDYWFDLKVLHRLKRKDVKLMTD